MKTSIAIPLSIGGIALLGLLTLVGVAVNFFSRDPLLRDILTWAGRLWAGLCGTTPLLLLVIAIVGACNLARWARVRAIQVHYRRGLLPASADPRITFVSSHDNIKAQIAQAVFDGHVDRANGSGMKALLAPRPDEEILQLAENSTREFAADEVIDPDPANRPDTFIVGQKGSGKTNVLRYIINRYREELPDAKFMILSTIASNWAGIDAITDPTAIYQAVMDLRTEIGERDETMRAAGVRDFFAWQAAPPKIVVIMDEAEAVADALKLENPKWAREFTGTLRIVVNTGRNFGMMFVVGTQTARADVLDPSMLRNASTLLMMRMDTQTAARFAVYGRDITDALPNMEPGRAYNPQRGGYVTFPFVPTLRLPTSSLLCRPDLRIIAGEETLLLTADAEADGLGDDDMPDGTTDTTVATATTGYNRHNGGGYQAVVPVVTP